MSPTGDEHYVDLLALERQGLLLNETLDQRDSPKRVNVLVSEILGYITVPVVSFVHVLVAEGVTIVYSKSLLEFHVCLSLLARCNVGVIRIVEPLLLKYLLDSINILHNL